MAKKYTITKAEMATDIGDKENPRLTAFEIDGPEEMQVSDGYHTMDELYEHRIALFIALCKMARTHKVWRSKLHSDGSEYEGWFIMGIGTAEGNQISYHLPMRAWLMTDFAHTLDRAPKWDGHTSAHVIHRLLKL